MSKRCCAETGSVDITGRLFDPVNHQCQNTARYITAGGWACCGTHKRMYDNGKAITWVKEGYEFVNQKQPAMISQEK